MEKTKKTKSSLNEQPVEGHILFEKHEMATLYSQFLGRRVREGIERRLTPAKKPMGYKRDINMPVSMVVKVEEVKDNGTSLS